MGWQIASLPGGLGEWQAPWDKLNQRLYGGHPFGDARFVDALLRCFGKGSERLCIHRTAGTIDGLLILYPRRAGFWTQFVPDQAQAAPVLLENTERLGDLFAALPGHAWCIEFLCQDPRFAPPDLLRESSASRLQTHALTMNVELNGTFEDYWNSRSRNLVKNMRRHEHHIHDEFGAATFRILTAPGEMHDAVARYGALESSGWKGRAGTAVNIDNRQGRFYAGLMSRFAATGQAEVAEYWLNDKLAASRLLVSGSNLTIILKTAYDESLAKFAPGRMLLKDYIEQAFALKRVSVVEFYTDATADQLAWATGQRHISHAMYFRSAFQARIHDAYQGIKQIPRELRAKTREPALAHDPVFEIQRHDNISQLPPDCRALFHEGEKDSFDLAADWFGLLESTVFTGEGKRIYVLLREGKVRGVLPLLFRRTAARIRQANSLTNYYSSLYRPLLSPAVTSDELAGYLRLILRDGDIDVLRLDAMDPRHPSFDILESAIARTSLRPYRFYCFGNWYLPVQGRSYQAYLQGLSSQLRNTLRRREKKFFAAGRGRLEIVTGNEGLEPAIAAWRKIYGSSWKAAEPFPEFVPGLIRMCAAHGWLRLGLAYHDGEPVAGQIWIVSHGRAAIYKLAYDEKFARLSAGTVLTAHLMRQVLDEDQVQEVDYLIGDDPYKKDWMSHRRERWGIVAYNTGTARGIAGAAMQRISEISRQPGGLLRMSKSFIYKP